MQLLDSCMNYLVHWLNVFTLSPWADRGSSQMPLLPNPSISPKFKNYPSFPPPNGPEIPENFFCEYPKMTKYKKCTSHSDRGCWLKPKDPKSGLPEFNINTDYEKNTPEGILRKYHLTASQMQIAPDGQTMKYAKLFNKQYPGPWIKACWGDTVEVTIKNDLPCNGTTIHWHGVRMLNNVENDGVNAITQCPVTPGDSFTYRFKVQQYGTTWYHSHYSLQYADGMAGPMTFFGPSSANYDSGIDPILMTDWNHRSAFEDWAWSLTPHGTRPLMTDALMNGVGIYDNCNGTRTGSRYEMNVKSGGRYLLRLINTSTDTTFIFSIDGHNLTVVESDFVPIKPYTNTSVLIGIGQRYHVIVDATPIDPTPDGNYWVRMVSADGCDSWKNDACKPENTTGILRYNPHSTALPQSKQNSFGTHCSDETYSSLVPVHEWNIPENTILQDLNLTAAVNSNYPPKPYWPSGRSRFQLHKQPAWFNFSSPSVLHLDDLPSYWQDHPELVVINQTTEDTWVELLITNSLKSPNIPHPIHLHGHDFAILAQSDQPYDPSTVKIKRDNPPRRDVVLLPWGPDKAGGYVIIAFKADNPGAWLVHCHIAWHASSGLAIQVLENVQQVNWLNKPALQQTCDRWDQWYSKWKGSVCSATVESFQDDSGI